MQPEQAQRWRVIGLLAVTQIVSWGSLYYAFGVLAAHMQASLGLSPSVTYGAYAWALLLSGLCAAPVGMVIDRIGGHRVLALGSVLASAGLWLLSTASGAMSYCVAWTVIGVAMSLTLYEAAFATINRCLPHQARPAISSLTLFGGLASTAFWPLSLALYGLLGWRHTVLAFALIQLVICLPLHLLLPRAQHCPFADNTRASDWTLRQALRDRTFWRLALAFAFNTLIFSALSVHLIPLFTAWHPNATVVLAAMAIGPMQVLGRYVELRFVERIRPSDVGRLVFLVTPLSLAVAACWGTHLLGLLAFCVLYGLSNGVMTIVRGTLPRELYGQSNYGAIAGGLAMPALLAKALGPLLLGGMQVADAPQWAFLILGGLGVAALLVFPRPPRGDGAGGGVATPSLTTR